jgi:hypothetical protein
LFQVTNSTGNYDESHIEIIVNRARLLSCGLNPELTFLIIFPFFMV